MALAESTFLAAALLTMIGIHRRWPLTITAFAAGLATATRPVGVFLTAAFLWRALFQSTGQIGARLVRAALLAPLACWGLLAYMAYQYVEFGNPFAFAQTQEHWKHQIPVAHPTFAEKAWALVELEPIRGVFDPESRRYWRGADPSHGVLSNLFFWNPVLFVTVLSGTL